MLHFFTDPYKDELIYSAISRYHFYTGNIDYKDTIEECFGKRTIVSSLDIGSPIEQLARNIGGNYTADYLISKHTILPYYIPFLPIKRRKQIIKEIKYKDCSGIYNEIGITAGSICKREGIFYCPICAENDIDTKGEAYIHREHQLQGIYMCPHHGILLRRYNIQKSDVSRLEFIRLEKRFINLDLDNAIEHEQNSKIMTKLAKDAYYLLEADLMHVNKNKMLKKYRNLLYEKGLATSSGRVRQRELYDNFISFYGEKFLEIMDSTIDKDNEYNWLRIITRDLKRTVHPIRHLLFINFLSGNIDEFFNDLKDDYNPFGKGPWPCLNKIAEHYGMSVINDLKITEDCKTRLPIGTFSCDCGFIYSRKGPDKVDSDKYRIGRIKKYGWKWENKLKGYLTERKYGLRELARLMYCDPKTIIKFDCLLEVNYFRKKDYIKETTAVNGDENNRMEIYKKYILGDILENPITTRNEIRNRCKKEYSFLYKHDKKWLFDNLPKPTISVNHNKKVDWNKKDNTLLMLIKLKYEELIKEEKPLRITKSVIGKRAGILADLEKNLDKLSETRMYLNEIIESVEEFQLRRCKRIIDENINNDEEIKLWKIQRLAGIRSKEFDKIKEKLIEYIKIQCTRGINE